MSSPGDALAQLQAKDERIRALEAELAEYDTIGGRVTMADYREMQARKNTAEARAEKAEAEAERCNKAGELAVAEWQKALKEAERLKAATWLLARWTTSSMDADDAYWTDVRRETEKFLEGTEYGPVTIKGGECETPGGGTSPSGVSPSPPEPYGRGTHVATKEEWLRDGSVHTSGRRTKTAARKERRL